MKTAIYIEDGVVQLVLTPSNKFERDAIKSFGNENLTVRNFTGSFYDCRGGWIRQSPSLMYDPSRSDDKSIIIRVDEKKEETEIENTNFPECLKIVSASKAMEITTTGNYPTYLFIKDITNNDKVKIRYKIDRI